MNVEIGTDAAQFPEKVYINDIFFAVQAAGLKQAIDQFGHAGAFDTVLQLSFCPKHRGDMGRGEKEGDPLPSQLKRTPQLGS